MLVQDFYMLDVDVFLWTNQQCQKTRLEVIKMTTISHAIDYCKTKQELNITVVVSTVLSL